MNPINKPKQKQMQLQRGKKMG